jgi:hypothetical protein
MAHLDDACKLLHDIEKSLRGLIERSLADQQYADVAAIAQMANAIARLHGDAATLPSAEVNRPAAGRESFDVDGSVEGSPVPLFAPRARVRRTARASEFPRFEREGDKLIKVGWSKRDDRAYEHRAPQQVVFLFANAIASKARRKGVFTMDRVLPLTDDAGNEIPSYQAYVSLAWLRSIGTVKRLGKEGYMLVNGALDMSALQRSWEAIPGR